MGSEVNCFEMWWPGTELNRRRQPFQGCSPPNVSVDYAGDNTSSLPDFALHFGTTMEPQTEQTTLVCRALPKQNRQRKDMQVVGG
jgi:hypothetical protein